jgi:hypothetical protein
VIFLQFSTYKGGTAEVQNFLVEGNYKTVPQALIDAASLVIEAVNQVDMFKARSGITVAADMGTLSKMVDAFYDC